MKAAKAFHPGQGVYRSSSKNAMRLARTEVNVSCRESDHKRMEQLDFIVGYEVHRANRKHVFKCKLCEKFKGKYPKDFVFKGWHPQCMCYTTPILKDEDDFDAQELSDLRSALYGEEYMKLTAKNEVTDVQQGFKDWVAENEAKQDGWASTPYFIKDNFVNGDLSEGLRFATGGRSRPVLADEQKVDKKIHTGKENVPINQDTPHKAMKTSYPDADSVNDTIKQINDEFTSDKWFEHGVGKLELETNPNNNGSSVRSSGDIKLTKDRLDKVRSAMEKIGNKKSFDITDKEADAMATYWHEITHNRNKGTDSAGSKTSQSRKSMELANEFVARKTLPEFYSKLGCNTTPHQNYMNSRGSTGYNDMVTNYDFIINKLGLDSGKVLKEVQKHLYNELYSKQDEGLKSGLVKGGLKKADGKNATKTEENKIVEMCRDEWKQPDMENWLKQNGFIK